MSIENHEETRDERYKRQTTEQFAALGRFVQEFDLMISAVRIGILQVCMWSEGRQSVKHQALLNVILHHDAMTAKPLFDIYRAVIATVLLDTDYNIKSEERDTTLSILKQLNSEYISIVSRRNEFLHGSWYIGWTNPTKDDFSEINFFKLKTSRTGLAATDSPISIGDIEQLIEQCARVLHLIRVLTVCLTLSISENRPSVFDGGERVKANFYLDGKVWMTSVGRG